jgi:hypothetical protein
MALDTNFNVNPYYDDFDEDKKFLRMLFKPGFAVQARELTQAQTLLQNQVDRFGRHIFRNGSVVEGGQFQIQGALYLKLDAEYSGLPITANNFVGKTILSTDDSKRAEVVKVFDAVENGDPATLMVKQLYGNQFVAGDTIKTDEISPAFANVATDVQVLAKYFLSMKVFSFMMVFSLKLICKLLLFQNIQKMQM